MKNIHIPGFVRLLVGAMVILMLGGLVGWYFYLQAQKNTITTTDTARGTGTIAPSFEGTTGSTQANQAIATQAISTDIYHPTSTSTSVLWQVDGAPVAGMGFVHTAAGENLNYVERGNGYVFSADPRIESAVRVTGTLLPQVYEALIAEDGSVIERSIGASGAITTLLGTVSSSTPQSASTTVTNVSRISTNQQGVDTQLPALSGVYLSPGIQSIVMNHTTRSLFYLTANAQGGVDGITQDWAGKKRSTIFSSTIRSWRPMMLDDGSIILTESPTSMFPGYSYRMDSKGNLTTLVRNIQGLTVLPKIGSPILLYGATSENGLALFARSTTTAQALGLATTAEKCVWLPGKSEVAYCAVPSGTTPINYLDSWYQGSVHTSDDWWKVDVFAGTAVRIYSPSSNNTSLDVRDPVIDSSGNYIAFINATNESLWVLRVAQ